MEKQNVPENILRIQDTLSATTDPKFAIEPIELFRFTTSRPSDFKTAETSVVIGQSKITTWLGCFLLGS